jgi:hypothetical protein
VEKTMYVAVAMDVKAGQLMMPSRASAPMSIHGVNGINRITSDGMSALSAGDWTMIIVIVPMIIDQ